MKCNNIKNEADCTPKYILTNAKESDCYSNSLPNNTCCHYSYLPNDFARCIFYGSEFKGKTSQQGISITCKDEKVLVINVFLILVLLFLII